MSTLSFNKGLLKSDNAVKIKILLVLIIAIFVFPFIAIETNAAKCEGVYDPGTYSCGTWYSDKSWCYNPTCGKCGYWYINCQSDGTWGSWYCSGEGECSPNSGQTEACTGSCGGYRSRTCQSNCQWGSFSGCSTDGQSCGSPYCGTGSASYYYYYGSCSGGSCSYSSSNCYFSTYCSGGVSYSPLCSSSGCTYNYETCTYGCASDGVNCASCTPSCTNPDGTTKVCGDNGCGGSCGSCTSPLSCSSGKCVCASPACSDQYGTCTSDGGIWQYGSLYKCLSGSWCNTCTDSRCGGTSTNCVDGNTCYANGAKLPTNTQYYCDYGTWKCTPNCAGKCGGVADGCGGTCPLYNGEICPVGSHCATDNTCVSNCQGYSCPNKCDGSTLKIGGTCEINTATGLPYCKYTETQCVAPYYGGCDPNTLTCKPCVQDCALKCGGAPDGCGGACNTQCYQDANLYLCINQVCTPQTEYCKGCTCQDYCGGVDKKTLYKNGFCTANYVGGTATGCDGVSCPSGCIFPLGLGYTRQCAGYTSETCQFGCWTNPSTSKVECKPCDPNKECGADSCNTDPCPVGYQCTSGVCCVYNQGQSCGCGGQILCKGDCSKVCTATEYCDASSASPKCQLKKDNNIACTSNIECKSNTCKGQTGNTICCNQDGCVIESASPKCLNNGEVDSATHKKCSYGALSCDTGYCADSGGGCWSTGYHDFSDGRWECKMILEPTTNAITPTWRKCTSSETGLCTDGIDNDCDGLTDTSSPDTDCCVLNYGINCPLELGCGGKINCDGTCSMPKCTSQQYCDTSSASPLCQPLRYNGDSCTASYQCYSNNCLYSSLGSKCCAEKACLDKGICYNNDQTWTDPAYKCSSGSWVCNTGYCEDSAGNCLKAGYYDTTDGKWQCKDDGTWFKCSTSETGLCTDNIDNDCDTKTDKGTIANPSPDEDCCDQTNKYGYACECGGTYDCNGKCTKPFICTSGDTKCENNNIYKCSANRCSFDLIESCTGGVCKTPYQGQSQCEYACGTDFTCEDSITACQLKCDSQNAYIASGSVVQNCDSSKPSIYQQGDEYCCKCAGKKAVGGSCSQNFECKSNICKNGYCNADCTQADTNQEYCIGGILGCDVTTGNGIGYNTPLLQIGGNSLLGNCCGNNAGENLIGSGSEYGCCSSSTACYSNSCGCTNDNLPCITDSKKLCSAGTFKDCSTPTYSLTGNYCCTSGGWISSIGLTEASFTNSFTNGCSDGANNDCYADGVDCADIDCKGVKLSDGSKCCSSTADCDDGNSCTDDVCSSNKCSNPPVGAPTGIGKPCGLAQGTSCGDTLFILLTCKDYTGKLCWDSTNCGSNYCWYKNGIRNSDGTGTGSGERICCDSKMGNECGCGGKIACDGITCSKPDCATNELCQTSSTGTKECIASCGTDTNTNCVLTVTQCTCASGQYADTTLSSVKNCKPTQADGTYFGNDYCCKCSPKKAVGASCTQGYECQSNTCEFGTCKCADADIYTDNCIPACDYAPSDTYSITLMPSRCCGDDPLEYYTVSTIGTATYTACALIPNSCAYAQDHTKADGETYQDPNNPNINYKCSGGTWITNTAPTLATEKTGDCKVDATMTYKCTGADSPTDQLTVSISVGKCASQPCTKETATTIASKVSSVTSGIPVSATYTVSGPTGTTLLGTCTVKDSLGLTVEATGTICTVNECLQLPTFSGISISPQIPDIGDVTITFTSSEPLVADPTININGIDKVNLLKSEPSGTGTKYTYTFTVYPTTLNGNYQVIITGKNANNCQGTASATFEVRKCSFADFEQDSCQKCGVIAQPKYYASSGIFETNTKPNCCGNSAGEFPLIGTVGATNYEACCNSPSDCVNSQNVCIDSGKTDTTLKMRCDNNKWVNAPPCTGTSCSISAEVCTFSGGCQASSKASIGDIIKITINAYDDVDVKEVHTWIHNAQWSLSSCDGAGETTTCTKIFQVTEQTPGIYDYYGYVYDTKGQGSKDTFLDFVSIQVVGCTSDDYCQVEQYCDIPTNTCKPRCGNDVKESVGTYVEQCEKGWIQNKGCQVCAPDCKSWVNQNEGKLCPDSPCTTTGKKAMKCSLGNCIDSGECSLACGANAKCDKIKPNDYLAPETCNNIGFAYLRDYCNAECNLIDDPLQICKDKATDSCTADSACNDKTSGQSGCTLDCKSSCISADTQSEYCTENCDQTKPSLYPGDAGIMYITQAQWPLWAKPNCCGNEIGEYLIKTETKSGTITTGTETGCCTSTTQCYSSTCNCIADNTLCGTQKLCSDRAFIDCSSPTNKYKLIGKWCCSDNGWKDKTDPTLKEICSDGNNNDCDLLNLIDEADKDCPITFTITPNEIKEPGAKLTATVNGVDGFLNRGNSNVNICLQGCSSTGACIGTTLAPNCNTGTCEFTYLLSEPLTQPTVIDFYACLGENSAKASITIKPLANDGEKCTLNDDCRSKICSKDYDGQSYCAKDSSTCVHSINGQPPATPYPISSSAPDCTLDKSSKYICQTDSLHGIWTAHSCGINTPTCQNNKIGTTVNSCISGSCSSNFVLSEDCTTKLSEGAPAYDPKLALSVIDYTTCTPSSPEVCQFSVIPDKCISTTQVEEYIISGSTYLPKTFDCKLLEKNYCSGITLMKQTFACSSGECSDTAVFDVEVEKDSTSCKTCVCNTKDACSPNEINKRCNGCTYDLVSSEAGSCSNGKDDDCDKYIDEQDTDCPIALSLNPNPATPSITITATITASYQLNTNTKKPICDYQGCGSDGSCINPIRNNDGTPVTCNTGSCTLPGPTKEGLYRYYVCIGNNVDDVLLDVKSTAVQQPISCNEKCKAEHSLPTPSAGGACASIKPDDACSADALKDYDSHTVAGSDCLQECWCYHDFICTGGCTITPSDDYCGPKILKSAGEICTLESECQSNSCRPDYASSIKYCAQDSTSCVHLIFPQSLATQYPSGSSAPDCTQDLSSKYKCSSLNSGQWEQISCGTDGWECNINTREKRDYKCTTASGKAECTHEVFNGATNEGLSPEDCTTKSSSGPPTYDHLIKHTVLDYTTCTPQACLSTPYEDICVPNSITNALTDVKEYKAVQHTYQSDIFNCKDLGEIICKDGVQYKEDHGCNFGECYYIRDVPTGQDANCKNCVCNVIDACSLTTPGQKCNGCKYEQAPTSETVAPGSCGNNKDDDCNGFTDEEDTKCPIALKLNPNPTAPSSTITAEITTDGSPNSDDSGVFICTEGCSTTGSCKGATIKSNCDLFSCTFTAPSGIGDYAYYTCIGGNSANNILKVTTQPILPQLPSCNDRCIKGDGAKGGTCALSKPFNRCDSNAPNSIFTYDLHTVSGSDCPPQDCLCYHEKSCTGGSCIANPTGDAVCTGTVTSLLPNGAECTSDPECESKKCRPDYTVKKYCARYDSLTGTTYCVHSLTPQQAEQYITGSFAPDCKDLSSRWKCNNNDNNGFWSAINCDLDGWYCNINTRENRDYYCTTTSGSADCKYDVIRDATSPEDCTLKISDGPKDYDVLKKQTVTDYTACSSQACQGAPFTDVCITITSLLEYRAVEDRYISREYDCELLETNYCKAGTTDLMRRKFGCTDGRCDDAIVDDILVSLNEPSCTNCVCGINSACSPTELGKLCNGCQYVLAPLSESAQCSDGKDNDCDRFFDEEDSDCRVALSLAPNPTQPNSIVTAEIKANDNTLNTGDSNILICLNGCTNPTSCTNCNIGKCTLTAPNSVNEYRYYACIGSNSAENILKVTPIDTVPIATLQVSSQKVVAGDKITLTVSANDDKYLSEVYYKKGETIAGTYRGCSTTNTCTYKWEFSELTPGTYTYTAGAKDSSIQEVSPQVTVSSTVQVISCDTCADPLCWDTSETNKLGRINSLQQRCCGANIDCTFDERCDLSGEKKKNTCIDAKTGFNPECCIRYSECLKILNDKTSPKYPEICPDKNCDCTNPQSDTCPCSPYDITVKANCAGKVRKQNGEPCSSNDECFSLYCKDGICQRFPS